MPQADLTSFHTLIVSTFFLVVFFFILTFYYMTPLWSLINKLNSKKTLVQFFLNKEVANSYWSSFILTTRYYWTQVIRQIHPFLSLI